MKKRTVYILCVGVPLLLCVVGKLLQCIEEMYSFGGYVGMVGVMLLAIGLFAAGSMLRAIKCPHCGEEIPEPQKELERHGILKCPRCGIIVSIKR